MDKKIKSDILECCNLSVILWSMLQLMVRTRKDSVALNQLIADCIVLNLNEKEALEYIEKRFGKRLSPRTYYLRKKNVDILDNANQWIDGFTKTGQILTIHQIMDAAQKQFNDTNYRLYLEQHTESRNENLILKLKADLREQGLYILKLSDTTPIILKIKQVIDENEKNKNSSRYGIKQCEDRFLHVV